ncbi:hypothetical protein SAMN05877838_2043 [Hoeflea halophila]|uniref:Uncharacterized protein n=1 Tax=Hoeflea halophila TaxID=714899 RepID=A0A286IAR1_9HYPH|nr:hypothetical protein [Hoeflea halophila]SOE17152.1 hypothetical protein SAMN05877838_2043 [Hoeflea halophila]
MTRLTYAIAKPVLLWALHFALIYALISAACAPRALLTQEVLVVTAAVLTLTAATLQIFWLWRTSSNGDSEPQSSDELLLRRAAWWTALISLIATLANLMPVLILPGCQG